MQPNNPGSFMGGNGAGSALMRLMQLRQQGASPGALNGNTQNPQAVMPAAPNTGNAIIPNQLAQAGQGGLHPGTGQPLQQPAVAPQNNVQPTPPTTPDDNLAIALNALAGYAKSHGLAHEAKNGVNESKARASVIASQARPQGGQ